MERIEGVGRGLTVTIKTSHSGYIVWLLLDSNGRSSRQAMFDMTPAQAREIAAALLRQAEDQERTNAGYPLR